MLRYPKVSKKDAVHKPKPVIYTSLMLENTPVEVALKRSLNQSKKEVKKNMALLKRVYKKKDLEYLQFKY